MKEKFLNKGIAETDDVAKAAVEEVAQEVTQPSTGSIITGAVIADIEDLPPIVKGPPTEFLPDPNNR